MPSAAVSTAETPQYRRFDVQVAGGSLAVFEFGAAMADPAAPPALAIHGITSNSRNWVAAARELERLRLIAPDLRGRGRSNHLEQPLGIAAHVDDMVAVLDEARIEQAVVVGHSLGAYVAARLAVEHPERVLRLVLVDGGLTLPGAGDVDPDRFIEAALGPAMARLELRFESRDAYRRWWHRHPAIDGSDIAQEDIDAYADHDLDGEPPELRSSVKASAVRADGRELLSAGGAADDLDLPAALLCAPRGLQNDPNPMHPWPLVRAWADAKPDRRKATLVEDCNHYSIVLGRRGAAQVASVIAGA